MTGRVESSVFRHCDRLSGHSLIPCIMSIQR